MKKLLLLLLPILTQAQDVCVPVETIQKRYAEYLSDQKHISNLTTALDSCEIAVVKADLRLKEVVKANDAAFVKMDSLKTAECIIRVEDALRVERSKPTPFYKNPWIIAFVAFVGGLFAAK